MIRELPDFKTIPRLDEPAKICGLTVLVSVQCNECGSPQQIGLINAQKGVCEGCGAVFNLERVSWRKDSPMPKIELSATPSRAKALSS